MVKQGQGHSASPGARLYGADASDDPAGFFAFFVDLPSTSDADTLDDEDLWRQGKGKVSSWHQGCYISSVQGWVSHFIPNEWCLLDTVY